MNRTLPLQVSGSGSNGNEGSPHFFSKAPLCVFISILDVTNKINTFEKYENILEYIDSIKVCGVFV